MGNIMARNDNLGSALQTTATEAMMDKRKAKKWAKRKLANSRDELAMRAGYAAKHYALGALQMLCRKAGKESAWWYDRVGAMFDRNDDLRQWDVFRRIGACYVKFLPQRVGAA